MPAIQNIFRKTAFLAATMLLSTGAFAQGKPTIAVLNIATKGLVQDAQAMGYLVRLELEKTGVYSVMDRYEVADVVAKAPFSVDSCFSKTCLVDIGRHLGVAKMMSGSAERFGEKIVITLRLIDVASGTIEKSEATEYLNLPEVQKMVVMTPYQADMSGRAPKLEAPKAEVPAPAKRESKKAEAPTVTKKDLDSVVKAWSDEE